MVDVIQVPNSLREYILATYDVTPFGRMTHEQQNMCRAFDIWDYLRQSGAPKEIEDKFRALCDGLMPYIMEYAEGQELPD